MTETEQILWDKVLRNKQFMWYKFLRQKMLSFFIVDFYCSDLKLVIEIDWWYHNDKKEYDLEREVELKKLWLNIIRFLNEEILWDLDIVINKLKEFITPPDKGVGGLNNPYIQKVKDHPKILTELETEVYTKSWDWSTFFGNKNDIVLEIWTWLWNFFSKNVNEDTEKNFIWMEIRYKRCFMTAEKSLWNIKNNDNSKDNTNLENYNDNFVIVKDYAEKISKIFADEELSETLIFFPDPWGKKKSWLKRRLFQENFINELYKKTKKGWKVIFKTDHIWYFLHALCEIQKTPWKLEFKTFDYENEGLYENNSITEFEQIFRGQNIKINYLELVKE